jgi:ribonuclease D
VENLLSPDLVRRLAWAPPAEVTAEEVGAVLAAGGARHWQIALAAPLLAEALTATATPPESVVTDQ